MVIVLLDPFNPPCLDIAQSRWPESTNHFRGKPVPEASLTREIDLELFYSAIAGILCTHRLP